MADLNTKVFEQLIRPDFDASVFKWDDCVELAGEVIANRELSNKVIGKLAAHLDVKRGNNVLQRFAADIENSTGVKVSYRHVANCRGIYKRLQPFMDKIPADWTWHAWALIAYTENPGEWIDRGVREGLTSPMLIREVQIAKGIKRTDQKVCPKCGHVW